MAKSDPLEQAAEELWRTLPHCAGGDVCDGDLVATPHEPACPMYPDKEEPTIFEFAALVARSPAVRREIERTMRWEAMMDVARRLRSESAKWHVGSFLMAADVAESMAIDVVKESVDARVEQLRGESQ